jgi:hypothetical protein
VLEDLVDPELMDHGALSPFPLRIPSGLVVA